MLVQYKSSNRAKSLDTGHGNDPVEINPSAYKSMTRNTWHRGTVAPVLRFEWMTAMISLVLLGAQQGIGWHQVEMTLGLSGAVGG